VEAHAPALVAVDQPALLCPLARERTQAPATESGPCQQEISCPIRCPIALGQQTSPQSKKPENTGIIVKKFKRLPPGYSDKLILKTRQHQETYSQAIVKSIFHHHLFSSLSQKKASNNKNNPSHSTAIIQYSWNPHKHTQYQFKIGRELKKPSLIFALNHEQTKASKAP
jgi:hypothetical protein